MKLFNEFIDCVNALRDWGAEHLFLTFCVIVVLAFSYLGLFMRNHPCLEYGDVERTRTIYKLVSGTGLGTNGKVTFVTLQVPVGEEKYISHECIKRKGIND